MSKEAFHFNGLYVKLYGSLPFGSKKLFGMLYGRFSRLYHEHNGIVKRYLVSETDW